jgi:uncharacterized protein (TIGR02466 family)
MALHQVFSSQIYQARCLQPGSSLFRALQKEVRQIETADEAGRSWSRAQYPNGYTSYGSWDQLHRMSPHFQGLQAKIDGHVGRYVKSLQWDVPVHEIQLTRLWVNIMKPNTIHTMHIHPLSVVSGTFYLEVPTGSSPIKFEDPRFNLFMGRPPLKAKASPNLQSFLHFQPRPGDVILFESWMRHEVPLNTTSKNRISISFNYDWIRG